MTPLDRVRALASALPGATERESHGQPTFFVADEPFAQFCDDCRAGGSPVVCVLTGDPDEQATLIDAAPDTYSRPAHLDNAGWVAMNLVAGIDWTLVEDRIARSWELAAPAALLEAGGR